MSNRYWLLPELELRPGFSPRLRLLVGLVLAASLLALWQSALHPLVSMIACALLIQLAILDLKRPGGSFAQSRIQRLCCRNARWRLELESGDCVAISPRPDSLVLPWLVVLRARVERCSRPCTVVLTRDACSAECWRCLQLNLRQTTSVNSG